MVVNIRIIKRNCRLCKETSTIQNLNCYGYYYLCDMCKGQAEAARGKLSHSQIVRELLRQKEQ